MSPILLSLATAQAPGAISEMHPRIKTWRCTKASGCNEQESAIVLDAGTHLVHQRSAPSLSCSIANSTVCPDAKACSANCIIEGIANYTDHGVTTKGSSLFLKQLKPDGSVMSPRVYLMSPSKMEYEMLRLTGNELAFDVNVSKLPCGMNGALYLSEMAADGGKNQLNKAGAKYGTGYCDAQCFVQPWLNGVANTAGLGACCNEMDIWEANAIAEQLAPHICNQTGFYGCVGAECTFDGVCDKNGCGQNPYALGNPTYYGRGLVVDTNRPFTVITQFPAVNGTLTSIRRLYVQDGKVIENASIDVSGVPAGNEIDTAYCKATGATRFLDLGGMQEMGDALARGMVLAFSVWWDTSGYMTWLDSGNAGPCNATEGNPSVIAQVQPDTAVTFSQIKWGEIGSTYTSK
ncbi:concanavalin A-like lectin/glucanase domain-containing protein [Calycina marina]|uniref:Glucanase n=1 Tax=Calycina marina TaxID=1763456 RepID=A0A9P7ZCV4_9HELO|nr:concanavalin A-like lectin/glucanase domain-containing protein [Calycina marina]